MLGFGDIWARRLLGVGIPGVVKVVADSVGAVGRGGVGGVGVRA